MTSETTQEKRKGDHLAPYRFQPGNPGRPKGSRNKLAEDFLKDVLAEWESHGAIAVSDMREKNPGDFVKMVASLLPKDVNLNFNNEIEMSDDEIRDRIRDLANQLAPLLGGTGAANAGAEAPTSAAIAPIVH